MIFHLICSCDPGVGNEEMDFDEFSGSQQGGDDLNLFTFLTVHYTFPFLFQRTTV